MKNLVIAYSQQRQNKCRMGDTEHDHMYLIAQALYLFLKPYNELNLYLIPPQNTGSDSGNLRAATQLSNEFIKKYGPGYHIELHSDAGAYAKGASGLYYSDAGKKFINPIMEKLKALTPWGDVGIRQHKELYALKNTKAIAGLIEVSFHDNLQEAKWIHDNIQIIAETIGKGILDYFGISKQVKETQALNVVLIDPMDIRATEILGNSTQISTKFSNFVNSNFFWISNGVPLTIGWLISDGKVLHERHEYKTWKGNVKGTFIIYKDGHIEAGWKYDSDIAPVVDDILFCCQGFNLMPLDIAKEGFDPASIGYKTNRLALGYNGKKLILVGANADAVEMAEIMTNLGCTGAIGLDSGGSSNLCVNGKFIYKTDRTLSNILYW